MHYFRFLLQCKWDVCFSGILSSVDGEFVSDILEKPIGAIFKGQIILDCFTFEDGMKTTTVILCTQSFPADGVLLMLFVCSVGGNKMQIPSYWPSVCRVST
jgi:hypothetical protein